MFKKILFVVLALVVVGVIFGGGNSDKSTPASADQGTSTSTDNATSGGSSSPGNAKIGQSVKDGKFKFTVKSLDCGLAKIGHGFMASKAQGQYCIATMKVTNIGNESQMFDGSDQYLYDASKRKFEASSDAIMSLPQSQSFLEDINPGNSVVGKVVWDVPASGFKADHLELHDSMFSGGVVVDLR